MTRVDYDSFSKSLLMVVLVVSKCPLSQSKRSINRPNTWSDIAIACIIVMAAYLYDVYVAYVNYAIS